MNEFNAQAAIVLDEEGEIDLLLPIDDEVAQSDACLFLMSIYHRANQEPSFYQAQLQWIKREMREQGYFKETNDETHH